MSLAFLIWLVSLVVYFGKIGRAKIYAVFSISKRHIYVWTALSVYKQACLSGQVKTAMCNVI